MGQGYYLLMVPSLSLSLVLEQMVLSHYYYISVQPLVACFKFGLHAWYCFYMFLLFCTLGFSYS